jgi:hypothetical protein
MEKMNKLKTLVLTATIATGLMATSAYAEESDAYFGIGVYQSTYKQSGTIGGTTFNVKYKNNNYKVLIGKRINDNWSIEGQYVNLAKDKVKVTVNGVGVVAPIQLSGSSIGVAGLYHFNSQADYSPFVKLGYHSWDFELVNTDTGVSAKADGTDVFYGVGVDGKINETMKYRVEFERMKINSAEVDNIGVGLLVNF